MSVVESILAWSRSSVAGFNFFIVVLFLLNLVQLHHVVVHVR